MPSKQGRIYTGIGGWTYAPWRGEFYPKGLPHAQELRYAASHLTSIEINGTFYRTQSPASYRKWASEVPDGFVFSLKANRFATNRKLLHIAGDDKPAEVIRSRFMKLNADHIRFVLKCLAENSSPIRNMKQYLLASLYNAPTTMQLSYQNQTNHDLAMRR